jgi:hypothetical protein
MLELQQVHEHTPQAAATLGAVARDTDGCSTPTRLPTEHAEQRATHRSSVIVGLPTDHPRTSTPTTPASNDASTKHPRTCERRRCEPADDRRRWGRTARR